MSIVDRHPRLRWAVPAAAGALVAAGAAIGPLGAAADSGLPERTAAELLVAMQEAEPTPVSGTVSLRADLGLPDLPMGMAAETGPMALASGQSTIRVWSDGPQRQRLALVEPSSETTVVRNGSQAWVWSSAQATADRYTLPEAGDREADLTDLPETPQQAADMALAAIDETTEVTTSGVARVAGRDVYELILTPRGQTLVKRVVIGLDAETMVPLRAQVFSTVTSGPAVDVGFTSVDFGTPDQGLFEFTPPPGATVTEHDGADGPHGFGPAADSADEPTVVGEGWSAVMVAVLPPGALADLAEAGSGEADWGSPDAAVSALALLESLPQQSGDWGSGRVWSGTLTSVIVTDDGRVAVGAVPPDALGAALASQ